MCWVFLFVLAQSVSFSFRRTEAAYVLFFCLLWLSYCSLFPSHRSGPSAPFFFLSLRYLLLPCPFFNKPISPTPSTPGQGEHFFVKGNPPRQGLANYLKAHVLSFLFVLAQAQSVPSTRSTYLFQSYCRTEAAHMCCFFVCFLVQSPVTILSFHRTEAAPLPTFFFLSLCVTSLQFFNKPIFPTPGQGEHGVFFVTGNPPRQGLANYLKYGDWIYILNL